MVRLIYIFALFFILTSCIGRNHRKENGQREYFRPVGIIDRTKEFSGRNIWVSLNDKERIDGYSRIGDSIFGGEIACYVEPLKNIDIKTFQVLTGTDYAKDKKNVYYPLQVTCIDYIDCGVCFYTEIIVKRANPLKFKYLGKDYATDGKLVFFRGKLLRGADGATFKVIEGPRFFFFATDKNQVYEHDKIFQEADPTTFYYGKTDPRNKVLECEDRYIIGDKNHKWEFIPPDKIRKID